MASWLNYKVFIDVLTQPLLKVWIEALHFGALPKVINEGVIKLIHERGDEKIRHALHRIKDLRKGASLLALQPP